MTNKLQNKEVQVTEKGANTMNNDYQDVNYVTACVDNGYNAVTGESEFTTKWLSSFTSADGRKFADIIKGLNTLVRFGAMEKYEISVDTTVAEDGKVKMVYNIKTVGLNPDDSYNTKNGVRKRFGKASAIAEAIKTLGK